MTHTYPHPSTPLRSGTSGAKAAGALLATLFALHTVPVAAQGLNYIPAYAQNLLGTYQDLGTTGTVIATANSDDANSAPQSIGFAFPFNNSSPPATTFILNTNGFLKLGGSSLPDPDLFLTYAQREADPTQNSFLFPGGPVASTDSRATNILAPFATDLMAASGGGTEYRVATTGTAPNRVCTIQWKNVRDKPRQAAPSNTATIGTQYDNFSFQVKLYETTGQIDFVYGPCAAGSGPEDFRAVVVGIKGTTSQTGDLVMADKGSTAQWATAFFRPDYYTGPGSDPHNVRSSVRPEAGRTYRFRASAPTDASLSAVYTLGQLPVGTPHTVQAAVYNTGTQSLTNLPVRLDVAGPNSFTNTQTIATLAPGAGVLVTFAQAPPSTRLGNHTITVSVPADALPDFDRITQPQTVTANTINYAPPITNGSPGNSYGFDTGEGITAVKYTAPRATTLLAVTNHMSTTSTTSVGQPIYAVALDGVGNILGTTPDHIVQSTDLGAVVTLTFPAPVTLAAGDFVVGIAQRASVVGYYPVGLLSEGPVRSGAFFGRNNLLTGPFNDVAPSGFGPFAIGAVLTNTVTSTPKATPNLAFALAPNPARTTAQLTLPIAAQAAQAVLILDALGRPVRTLHLPARATQTELDVAGLPRGVYVVRVGSVAQRLVLE